jgi:ADP-ribose pyrophosphatase YjhB (NUDIX family)
MSDLSAQNLYTAYPKIPVAVDCVIFGYEAEELKLLLYPRNFAPSQGAWSLMGGFVQEDESMEDTVKRVLRQTVDLEHIYVEQVGAYSDPGRDPGGRVISMAYYALIRIDEHDKELVSEKGGKWWPVTSMPGLIFDHGHMVKDALTKLQKKASYELIGKDLLPKTFTLTQLNNLYNAIFQREFNAGNFRKKLATINVLEKLNKKDNEGSKRGAFLYSFKKMKSRAQYERIVKL